jgi:hypothetical protein
MEEERGVSIGEIFKVIFKRVWWVVGAIAACALVLALLVQLWYNPSKQTYSVEFSIEYPDKDTGLYPDGTAFRYQDIIELDTLNYVKSTSDSFSSINVEKMHSSDAIKIERTQEGTTENPQYSYTLTVSVKYFSDSEQAQDFIRTLSAIPVTYINSSAKDVDYASILDSYNTVTTYEQKIKLLDSQKEYLVERYNNFIELYGTTYKVEGKTLASYLAAVQSAYDDDETTNLTSELNNGGFIFDSDKMAEENAILEAEKANNKNILEELKKQFAELYTSGTGAAGADASSLDARIAYYTERNATIDNILNARADENYKKNNTAFANKLDAYKVALENQAASLKTVSIAIYSGQSKTIYTTNRISVDGGVNIIIAAVAGAVLGFIIAAIVICIIDMPKYIKARDKKQEDEEEEKSKS